MPSGPETALVAPSYADAVSAALEEDLGGGPDVTTRATVDEDRTGEAHVLVKAEGVLCGLGALDETFHRLDPRVRVVHRRADGDEVSAGDVAADVSGPLRAVLTGERTALNLVGHLSGVATLTRAFVRAAGGVQVTETRKTLPGLRALEKYAVRCGGGSNHRFALHDGVLVKDNHIRAAGGIGEAVRRAGSSGMPVEVECSTPEEVDEALEAGARALLLDNFPPDRLRALVGRIRTERPAVFLEASGGITLETASAYAACGVDRISIGALTHSAPALDVSLELVAVA